MTKANDNLSACDLRWECLICDGVGGCHADPDGKPWKFMQAFEDIHDTEKKLFLVCATCDLTVKRRKASVAERSPLYVST